MTQHIQTCSTCKWWTPNVVGDWPLDRLDGRHRCDLEGSLRLGLASFDIEFTVDDDTNASTRLITGPDFGCVHHTQKEVS